MSQDPSFVTKFSHSPGSPGYNNSFNTTGSLIHNTRYLGSFDTYNNCPPVSDDWSEILTWLSPLEPRSQHCSVRSRRVGSVGDWLLRTEEFRSWHSGDGQGGSQKATIFCSGNPGVGKTYIW